MPSLLSCRMVTGLGIPSCSFGGNTANRMSSFSVLSSTIGGSLLTRMARAIQVVLTETMRVRYDCSHFLRSGAFIQPPVQLYLFTSASLSIHSGFIYSIPPMIHLLVSCWPSPVTTPKHWVLSSLSKYFLIGWLSMYMPPCTAHALQNACAISLAPPYKGRRNAHRPYRPRELRNVRVRSNPSAAVTASGDIRLSYQCIHSMIQPITSPYLYQHHLAQMQWHIWWPAVACRLSWTFLPEEPCMAWYRTLSPHRQWVMSRIDHA